MSNQDSEERVNHPRHYNHVPGIECLDVIQHFDFVDGCIIKYVWRAPTKSREEALVDYRKALFYLQYQIQRLEKDDE